MRNVKYPRVCYRMTPKGSWIGPYNKKIHQASWLERNFDPINPLHPKTVSKTRIYRCTVVMTRMLSTRQGGNPGPRERRTQNKRPPAVQETLRKEARTTK